MPGVELRTLEAGTIVVEAIGAHLKLDMRDYWQPDNAFFALTRDKAAINAMLRHADGKRFADGNVAAPGKTQKKIIRDFLAGEGRKKVEGWLPRHMGFPFGPHTKSGGVRLSDSTDRIKSLVS